MCRKVAALRAPSANKPLDRAVCLISNTIIACKQYGMLACDGASPDGVETYLVPGALLVAGMPVVNILHMVREIAAFMASAMARAVPLGASTF